MLRNSFLSFDWVTKLTDELLASYALSLAYYVTTITQDYKNDKVSDRFFEKIKPFYTYDEKKIEVGMS